MPITADDAAGAGEPEDNLGSRYSVAGVNMSAARFCGPGVATAVHITRFNARHCGSIERLLKTVPAVGDRFKLLRWESFARRKQRVAGELLSWLGAEANATAVAATLRQIDGNVKAFNNLPDKSPVSPRSRFVIEEQCAGVMSRLGYKATAADALAGRPEAEAGSVSPRKKARGKNAGGKTDESGADSASSSNSVLLLRHTYKPSFLWCPIRLAAAGPLFRFVVRVSTPRATTGPSCFPDHAGDRCPMRRSKWTKRWGEYPFEVVEEQLGSRRRRAKAGPAALPGFSFAIIRNPFDRLVSAYINYIDVPDKATAVYRAWIRELHNLGDKDPISFSHFVRWVTQQEPAVMHRPWQPYTETCKFGSVQYSFIGRVENLSEDMARIMQTLGMGERERKLLEHIFEKSRPPDPPSDRQLRLLHYYYSDDDHDLVAMVRKRYQADIELGRYEFNLNASALTHW
jgi:hypothetical protein